MARRKSPWHVERSSKLDFAFFISHVSEDSEEVKQLKSEIAGLSGRGGRPGLSCYLDVHNWEDGIDPGNVIRSYLLKSKYFIAWLTRSYVEESRRGWIWYEFAYAELIELSLNTGSFGDDGSFILLVPRGVGLTPLVERSPLINYWSRKLNHPTQDLTIPEIARKLVDFYDQEARKRVAPPGGLDPS